jgi:hypothetical protein
MEHTRGQVRATHKEKITKKGKRKNKKITITTGRTSYTQERKHRNSRTQLSVQEHLLLTATKSSSPALKPQLSSQNCKRTETIAAVCATSITVTSPVPNPPRKRSEKNLGEILAEKIDAQAWYIVARPSRSSMSNSALKDREV